MSDDSFDSVGELPPPPRYEDDDDVPPQMGRSTTADLEAMLEDFRGERYSRKTGASDYGSVGAYDIDQLDGYLNETDSEGRRPRFSEVPKEESRQTFHSFISTMEYADDVEEDVKPKNAKPVRESAGVSRATNQRSTTANRATAAYVDEDDGDEEVEVKPKNAKPKQQAPVQRSSGRASVQQQQGGGKYHNPVGKVETDARKGPTYPQYAGTPVQDARRPKREKAIETETKARPQVFMVDKPDDHLESNVYFSGTVSFNDHHAADRFLQLVTELVNRSAVVFHEIKEDNPGAAVRLESLVQEMLSMLHHFTDSSEEETAKEMCRESIGIIERESRDVINVLRRPPLKGNMWSMEENKVIASSLKIVLSEVCKLMKVSEREQAQQFMVVVKTCLDTVQNILNSHKRHCGIFFGHLQGYMDDHLYPLLDNRIQTTPDEELKQQYRNVQKKLRQTHPAFRAYMDGQWPPNAHERAKTAASYEEKREGAAPYVDALTELEDILKTLLNPVSDFEIRFNMPRKPLEEITQNLVRASARQDKAAVLESAKQLTETVKQLPPDDPHVAKLRLSTKDLIDHSRKVLAKQESPEQIQIIADAMLEEAAVMEEEQVRRSRRPGAEQDVVDAMAEAAERLALIEADPMRVSTTNAQQRMSVAIRRDEPQHVQPMRVSRTESQRALDVDTVRKSAARISSRASVVVALADRRGNSKKKGREELYEASNRVAKALQELAELEKQPDVDAHELQRLLEEVDSQQVELFEALPPPSPAASRRSQATREDIRKTVGRASQLKSYYEKQTSSKKPNERLTVAAEKVLETLEELEALENDATAGDDELAILVEEATKHQKDMLNLAKDPKNYEELDDFMNEF